MLKVRNILIILFVAIIIGMFFSIPRYRAFMTERNLLDAEKQRLAGEERHLRVLEEMEQELVANVAILERIRGGVPSEPVIPSIFRYLEQKTSEHGLTLNSIGPFSVSEFPEKPHMMETQINLSVSGASYQDLKRFADDLERSIKVIVVDSVNVSVTTTEEGDRFTFTMVLRTYSY